MAGFGDWLRGAGLRIADRFVSGNNYNRQTGQWTATPGQYVTGGVGTLLGLVNPALGTLFRKGSDYYYNHNGNVGGPTQSTIPTYPSVNVGDLSFGNFTGGIGFPTTAPTGTNPFAQFDPTSGNIFDPTGYFSDHPGGNSSGGFTGGFTGGSVNNGGGLYTSGTLGGGATVDPSQWGMTGLGGSNLNAWGQAQAARARQFLPQATG